MALSELERMLRALLSMADSPMRWQPSCRWGPRATAAVSCDGPSLAVLDLHSYRQLLVQRCDVLE